MKSTDHRRDRNLRKAVPALMMCAMLSLAGCGGTEEEDLDAIANGEDGQVGVVQLRSMLLVAAGEGQPGRLLGTLVNESSAPVEVTISDPDDQVTVTVPADGQYPLDTNEQILDTVQDRPGALTALSLTTPADSTELKVPVMDGTLDPYKPYLPD